VSCHDYQKREVEVELINERDTIDFYVGGAQFGWNSINTESQSTDDEKKLWIDSKGGKINTRRKGKAVNLFNHLGVIISFPP